MVSGALRDVPSLWASRRSSWEKALRLTCRRRDLAKSSRVHSFLVRLLLGICAALGPLTVRAAETAAKSAGTPAGPAAVGLEAPAPAVKAAPGPDAEVYTLPKIEITARRVKELDREIKKLDKAISREKKNLKASELDKVLNNPKLAQAAAVFGGNSAAYLETVAASRVGLMETERDLLSDMRKPRTLEELTLLQTELERVRTMQRELDKTSH